MSRLIFILMVVVALVTPALAQPTADGGAQEMGKPAAAVELPHIHIDRKRGRVELEAKVVRREVDWLELLACSPNTREHESVLTTEARPSQVHLALLLVGLEPGQPMRWVEAEDGNLIAQPAAGPLVEVRVVYIDGQAERSVPAGAWLLNRETGQSMPHALWRFTGSVVRDWPGADERVYMADREGTVLSIVNFGNEVLARPTDRTNQNDQAAWGCNTDAIPPEGTDVTIRLIPLRPIAVDAPGQLPEAVGRWVSLEGVVAADPAPAGVMGVGVAALAERVGQNVRITGRLVADEGGGYQLVTPRGMGLIEDVE